MLVALADWILHFIAEIVKHQDARLCLLRLKKYIFDSLKPNSNNTSILFSLVKEFVPKIGIFRFLMQVVLYFTNSRRDLGKPKENETKIPRWAVSYFVIIPFFLSFGFNDPSKYPTNGLRGTLLNEKSR